MMNTWKPNMEEAKQRYVDWWNHKGIIVNMWEHFQQGVTPHAEVAAPPPPKDLNQKWFDPEWRADYLDWYVAHSSLKADMLPVANTQLGPGSLAAILGGVFEGGEDTIWIHPNPNYSDKLTFDEQHPNWLLHKQLLKACKRKAQGHYYVGMPDLMEGLDVLAAIKGTDKVLLDTVMQPEVLEEQMQWINNVYFKVFDELYDIIREGNEMAFCYFSAWAPGKMSKLQSDISTMISDDDYRRFVQPFIREQCQKIDYTLYHLDGVGAMHHLPALLEIEELNAIQWTPGVGQPQGGSPKWYDLYRKILEGGKSIMACWVTLDELRPLLDNIGGEGVHLEMDFHNEQEVEQALRTVEDFKQAVFAPAKGFDAESEVQRIINKVENQFAPQTAAPSAMPTVKRPDLREAMKTRILVLDGAMGTSIQQFELSGTRGSNEYLNIERPDVIAEIYRGFLAAGADIISTNTFNAQTISLKPLGLEQQATDINLQSARLARQMADSFTITNPARPRYVVGSIGPTRETISMPNAHVTREELRDSYQQQVAALIEGGVDGILFETIFDVENVKAGIEGAERAMTLCRKQLPIMLSFTVRTPEGFNMIGQDVVAFIKTLPCDKILSVGLNCSADIPLTLQLTHRLAAETPFHISVYPNAGLPDANNHYPLTPERYQRAMWPFIDQHLVNIVGGCCGTTFRHIAALAQLVQPAPNCWVSPHVAGGGIAVVASTQPNEKDTQIGSETVASSDKNTDATEATNNADAVFNAIINGKADDCARATQTAVDAGNLSPQDIINQQMIRAMGEVGQRFQDGKAFVPQLLMAGRAMKAGLAVLKPLMAGTASTALGKVVIGTVKGDLHDIGKNLVASMLEGCGFEVINIGIDVSADKFIEEVKKHEPDILCMSALLTTTMGYMKEVITALEAAGIRDKVKVMVGGAPVTQGFADEIGADGYSDNANSAVTVAKQLLGKM